ncbi:pantothenate kinase [Theileria orientalis]|uniref:Pantothenate kinase n=1 Tax=Theileria orientalis TaxID=68886 RepID=A0A976M6Z9_THEOR|nr:pantothenate kinase [Theileria orientalis]
MVSKTIADILNLQEKLLLSLDSNHYDIRASVLEDLLENLSKLIVKSCKTKTYRDFNTYFSLPDSNDADECEFTTFGEEEYKYAHKFLEESSLLKTLLYNKLKSSKNRGNSVELEQNVSLKLMKVNDDEFKNRILKASERVSVAMDIGGTFIKIMFKFKLESREYYEYIRDVYTGYLDCLSFIQQFKHETKVATPRNYRNESLPQMLEFMVSIFQSIDVDDGVLTFKYVPLSDLDLVVSTIKEKNLHTHGKSINLTGGGAYKYFEMLTREFKNVKKASEVICIIEGINFVQNMRNAVIQYDLDYRIPHIITMDPVYPYIISSSGSGMFMVKVSSPSEYKHLNGSAISGGTAFGLVNYVLPLNKPREFIKHLKRGTNKLDSFTEYPMDSFRTLNKTEPYGLSTSLGKLDVDFDEGCNTEDDGVTAEDLNKSIIDMISYNTGVIAYMAAKAYGVKRLISSGNYICGHTMDSIAAGFAYHSDVYDDRSIQLCFPFHGAYIPTIGCFIKEY